MAGNKFDFFMGKVSIFNHPLTLTLLGDDEYETCMVTEIRYKRCAILETMLAWRYTLHATLILERISLPLEAA